MAVRTQCPRCKQPLSVPNKLAGTYANCPRCQCRFWVLKDAPQDGSSAGAAGGPQTGGLTLAEAPVAAASGPEGPPRPASSAPAGPAAVAPPPAPPRQHFPSITPVIISSAPAVAAPSADASQTPAAPPQARKVARLVSADAAQSTLKLAADGQLPELQLQEIDRKDKGQDKSRSIPPLVMIAAWVLSVAATIVIVMIGNDSGGSGGITKKKREALATIEDPRFFGAGGQLLPHQKLLHDAHQARARKDYKAERTYYKRVLDLLHTETWGGSSQEGPRDRLEQGLTGSRQHDQDLEQAILTMLAD